MMMRGGAKKCSQSQVTYLRNRTTVEQVDLLPSLSLQYVSAHHIRGICGIGELLRLLVIKVSVWVGLCVCGLVRMYRSDIVCWPHCGLVSKSIVISFLCACYPERCQQQSVTRFQGRGWQRGRQSFALTPCAGF